jgi:tripartite-type tricarboxylate transporter receptor subunit TctC
MSSPTPTFTPSRRALVCAALGLAAGTHAWAQQAPASTYPNRPVTVMVAFSAGSGPDVLTRMVTNRLSALWGHQVIIDNRPGGAGFVAVDAARRVAPDGYTLLMLDSQHLSAVPHLYRARRNFEPLKVFDVAAPLFKTSFLLAVPATSPWNSVQDLIAAAKARPGEVNYGSWGIGSPGHLGGEWLSKLVGARMTHVPFKDTGQLLNSVATGEVHWSFTSIPSSQAQYKAGKIKYLGVTAPTRMAQMPEVPTMAESGGPAALELSSFGLFLTPIGVPEPIRAKIHADVLKVLAEPEIRKQLNVLAFEPLLWSVDDVVRVIQKESDIYRQLVIDANISLE